MNCPTTYVSEVPNSTKLLPFSYSQEKIQIIAFSYGERAGWAIINDEWKIKVGCFDWQVKNFPDFADCRKHWLAGKNLTTINLLSTEMNSDNKKITRDLGIKEGIMLSHIYQMFQGNYTVKHCFVDQETAKKEQAEGLLKVKELQKKGHYCEHIENAVSLLLFYLETEKQIKRWEHNWLKSAE